MISNFQLYFVNLSLNWQKNVFLIQCILGHRRGAVFLRMGVMSIFEAKREESNVGGLKMGLLFCGRCEKGCF